MALYLRIILLMISLIEIDELIKNKKKLLDLQKKSYQNFYLTNHNISLM